MLYKHFKPTGFDGHLHLEDREHWIVAPVSINRDTEDAETLSNWQALQNQLDQHEIDYEVHRFGHWANGWFEIILVEPSEKSEQTLEEVEGVLSESLVIDSALYDEVTAQLELEDWNAWGYTNFLRTLEREVSDELYSSLEELSIEQLKELKDLIGANK